MKKPVYIHATKEELETPEFTARLEKAYAEKNQFEEVYLVVDGKVLEDPNNGGAIKKIGKNLYEGVLSRHQFKLDNGDIDYIRGLSKVHPSGLHELLDPNNGLPLNEVEEGIYEVGTGKVYVAANEDTLEDPVFNEKLQELYKKHNLYGDRTNVKIMLDGKELTDPASGGEVIKTGPNEYKGVYSHNTMLLSKGKLLALRDPIAGTRMVKQEDGRYYSETLDKYFTLGEAKNGKDVFFPEYLPYDGMTNVRAQVIDDRLVGENGISLPITETGFIDGPMDDGLKTQEEIDESIAKKHELSEKALKDLQDKFDAEMKERKAAHEAIMAKEQKRIEAIQLAGKLESARIQRKVMADAYISAGLEVDPNILPPLPEIPEDMPLDMLQDEIDSLRALMNQQNKRGSLDFRNVEDATKSATGNDLKKASDEINLGMREVLNPEKESEKNNLGLEKEDKKDDDRGEI